MVGEVDVFGQYNYLEVWNHERFVAKLQHDPFTDADARALADLGSVGRRCRATSLSCFGKCSTFCVLREAGSLWTAPSEWVGTHWRFSTRVRREVIGLDRDPAALAAAADTLVRHRERVELVHSDYRAIDSVLDVRRIDHVRGVLADMGMSSLQLEAEGRGFSFQRDDPLDMRMDTTTGPTAAQLLREGREADIADAIYQFGEERFSRRIARSIVQARERGPIDTTGQLASIVRRAVPRRGFSRIDPATRTFQALRIWVNRELDGVDEFVKAVVRRLEVGARVVVITFHSLEDRIVKHTLRALAQGDRARIRILTKKPISAQPDEVDRNPRSRSAKLRAAECVSTFMSGLRWTSPVRSVRLQPDPGDSMSSFTEAFEYAIKKDVRNNPIIREVDEHRLREQWRSVAIGMLFVVVLLFSGWQRMELLQHGYRVEQLQKLRSDEEAINRHLRLEIETLKAPHRIERLAKRDLRLISPETGSAIVIERVVPPEPPPASVVAKSQEERP